MAGAQAFKATAGAGPNQFSRAFLVEDRAQVEAIPDERRRGFHDRHAALGQDAHQGCRFGTFHRFTHRRHGHFEDAHEIGHGDELSGAQPAAGEQIPQRQESLVGHQQAVSIGHVHECSPCVGADSHTKGGGGQISDCIR
jgi:hypothetical protein